MDIGVAGCRLVELSVKGDQRGSLIAIAPQSGLPFAIERVYYIFGNVEGLSRGYHAHRELSEWTIAVSGSCSIVLDDGQKRREVRLERPDCALEIGPMVWREMHGFTPDCVLLVIADAPYEEADYIRDYDEFRAAAAAVAP